MTDEARDAVAQLIAASSLETTQQSFDRLLDAVLPGRAATSSDADGVVAELGKALPRHPFPAYPLAVLVGLAQWVGVWSRIDSVDQAVEAAAGAELRTLAELRLVASSLMTATPFQDPEARSMSYLLIGAVVDATTSVPYLIRATENEGHQLVAACGVEAVVVALAKGSLPPDSDSVSWVRRKLSTVSVARSRVADAPFRYAGVDLASNIERVDALVGEQLSRDNMPRWPSESF